MNQIEFSKVSKNIRNKNILSDFSLNISNGSFVSLLGPSGCGKTSSLRILAGLDTFDSGQISLEQKIICDPKNNIDVPTEKRNLGMVFQSYAVWPHMNVFDNVAFPLKIKKIPKDEIQKRVHDILEIVELDQLSLRMPNELSGGQQQRVALARGLVMQPKALLLDEPLSNLDTKLRLKMRTDIKKIQKQFNLTMIYVTHDQDEAKTMSDWIVVMNEGRIQQQGPTDLVFKNPANEFVQDFLSY